MNPTPKKDTQLPIPLPLLQQRRIEAAIAGPLLQAFAREIGDVQTRSIAEGVVRELAQQGGCTAAQSLQGNTLLELRTAIERWRADDALTLTMIRSDSQALEFNVTRCRFAEMYRELGLEEWGSILSCGRDAAMVEGFNPAIRFQRTQTLMEGACHCDFRYSAPDPITESGKPE